MEKVLISRTRIDRDIWHRLKTMSEQMGTTREALVNTVLGKFTSNFDVKLVKKNQRDGEGRSYFDS